MQKEKLCILKTTPWEDMRPHRNLLHRSNYQGTDSIYHLLHLETNRKVDTLSDLQQTRASSEVFIKRQVFVPAEEMALSCTTQCWPPPLL